MWRIAVLLALTVGQPVPKEQTDSKKNEQGGKQLPPPAVVPSTPFPAKPEAAIKQDGTRSESDKFCFQWFWKPLLDNWPLVAVGIGGVWVAWQTLEDIKKQTANTANLAHAALAQSQAIISAERPWIVVEFEWIKSPLEGFVFKMINRGQTPAEIVSAYFEREFLVGPPDNLPIPPRYHSPILLANRGDSLLIKDEEWPLNPAPIHVESWMVNTLKTESVRNAEEFPIIYGEIIYRDMLHGLNSGEAIHYTRWCFAYDAFMKVLRPSGPSEYRSKS